MAEYHKYVFDTKNRKFIGEFEQMYEQESVSNFDSWHQEDSRQLKLNIALSLINEMNFAKIIDIGCGKGSFTHKLKKRNNLVYGFDVSKTAVEIARNRFPDIDFSPLDANNIPEVMQSLNKIKKIDLTFSSECISYIENWRELIETASKFTKYLMISLYIPNNPIGFVKSIDALEDEISKNFDIIESIHLTTNNSYIIFSKTQNT